MVIWVFLRCCWGLSGVLTERYGVEYLTEEEEFLALVVGVEQALPAPPPPMGVGEDCSPVEPKERVGWGASWLPFELVPHWRKVSWLSLDQNGSKPTDFWPNPQKNSGGMPTLGVWHTLHTVPHTPFVFASFSTNFFYKKMRSNAHVPRDPPGGHFHRPGGLEYTIV